MSVLLVRGCQLCPLSIDKNPTNRPSRFYSRHNPFEGLYVAFLKSPLTTGNSFSLFVWRASLNNLQWIS